MARPTKITIDLNALEKNLALVKHYVGDSKIVCCVKANAYGHGLVEVSKKLEEVSDALAVASLEEAEALRNAGIEGNILLLEGVFDSGEWNSVESLNLWSVIHNQIQLTQLCENAKAANSCFDLWLKVDSGMHRLGFSPKDIPDVIHLLKVANFRGNIRLMTHFACADELENEFTSQQLNAFYEVAAQFDCENSLANSAAIISRPDAHADWVRPGYMLYGLSPFGDEHDSSSALTPVMSFESEVIALRDINAGEGIGYNHHWVADKSSKIAVVAAGYGDGYPRNTENGTPVLVNGQRAKTVGRVAMDMLMVDVTDIEDVEIGSQVELWGKNLSVNEIAAYSGYSPYELLTRMPLRARRKYLGISI